MNAARTSSHVLLCKADLVPTSMEAAVLTPDPLHDIDLCEGRFCGTSPSNLDDAFDHFAASSTSNHLCIFFHGGLASRTAALGTARALETGFTEAGSYPFFFIWHSGLLDAIKEVIDKHQHHAGFVRVADLLAEFVAWKIDLALEPKSPRRATGGSRRHAALNLQELKRFAAAADRAWSRRRGEQLSVSSSELKTFARHLADAGRAFEGRGALFRRTSVAGANNPLAKVIRRMNDGHGHDLYTTVIEELLVAAGVGEFGFLIWDAMKTIIEDAFVDDPDAGGTAFLGRLAKAWKKKPDLRVTLIGHSAGAIYVQQFIEAFDADARIPKDARVEVILLAPAISFLRANAGLEAVVRRVRAIRTFGLSDKVESGYWEVKFIYDKSLLYIVSSLCEKDANEDRPLVGMQRYRTGKVYEGDRDIADVLGVIDPFPGSAAVWSPSPDNAPTGHQSKALCHGGMPIEKATNKSMNYILKHGF